MTIPHIHMVTLHIICSLFQLNIRQLRVHLVLSVQLEKVVPVRLQFQLLVALENTAQYQVSPENICFDGINKSILVNLSGLVVHMKHNLYSSSNYFLRSEALRL